MASGQALAQQAVAVWFPLHAGDKRIYDHETRDENGQGRAHLEVHRWKTEETSAGPWIVPEGTLFGRQVRIVEGSPYMGYRVDSEPAVLIRGDCLYRIGGHDWEPGVHRLTAEFLKWLAAGEISPDFCFPPALHKTWGAPHWGGIRPASEAKDWKVIGFDAQEAHITSVSSYPGSGTTEDIWLEKGVGVVREEKIHHGTIGEERTRLLHFQPAP